MNEVNLQYFIYGLCLMYYLVMCRVFWLHRSDRLSKMISVTFFVIAFEILKDVLVVHKFYTGNDTVRLLANSIDACVIPLYIYVLIELCRPSWLTTKHMVIGLLPFVFLASIHSMLGVVWAFYVVVGFAVLYSVVTIVWVFIELPRYRRKLKEDFSYSGNINLNWLKYILFSYSCILVLWIGGIYIDDIIMDIWNLVLFVGIWVLVCYFLLRHKNEISTLQLHLEHLSEAEPEKDIWIETDAMSLRIRKLFVEERIYLNSRLALSDVAKLIGTNRTYLSQYFNRVERTTFYDFVNGMRLEYSEQLLKDTDDNLLTIALKSGFNSLSTFRRSFDKKHNCSPAEFRKRFTNRYNQ